MRGRWPRRKGSPGARFGADAEPGTSPDQIRPNDVMLAETIARHFEGAVVVGRTAHIGLGGLVVECEVGDVSEVGSYFAAPLYLYISGGGLGPEPVFASVSGYGSSPEAAIVTGACNWACVFGPVLRAGLIEAAEPDVEQFETTLDGRRFRVVLDGLDRVMTFEPDDEAGGRIAAARSRLCGDPWLLPLVLGLGTLPGLAERHSTLVSLFVSDGSQGRTAEVKVNGIDRPACAAVFADAEAEPEGAVTLLRELAVLTPV